MSILAEQIRRLAEEAGYIACGFTAATPFAEFADALDRRIERFPEAAPLYDGMRHRINPCRTTPWAKSIVVCIRKYGKYRLPREVVGRIGRNYLADRRTPACPDYSMARQVTNGLRALGLRVKKGGVPDRLAAARAGVAAIGRNGFSFTPEAGSWINIATWRIDAELPGDAPCLECPCPPGCRACLDACPTGALVEPFVMRMDQCIAYLSYEAPLPIPDDLWTRMGPWIYGCDACQEVCPLNAGRWTEDEPAEWLERIREHLTPDALSEMSQETYERIIHPLFWYTPKTDLARWHANAKRALAQGREPARE